ncbi:MAG TPA: EAL domain-containing protein [Burkholderiales bacterium]|nr:EAL domain-containing protein [Burkholderiales bacterium]
MTLYRQLLLGVSALFFVLLAGVEAIYLSNSRQQFEQQLASVAQDAATALALRLGGLKDLKDRTLVETMLNPVFDRGYFQEIRVLSLDGETLVRRTLPPATGDVPAWFAKLFPLNPPGAQSLVSTGWRETGRVIVLSHPHFAYQQLWHSGSQTLAWMLAVYAVAVLLVMAFLAMLLRPLRELERAAAAIGQREFVTIDRLPRARELASVVTAMNSMSGKIGRMIEHETARAEALRREAFIDPLTSLYNRRGFDQQLQSLLRSDGEAASSALAIVEFQKFGEFNARVGFQRGDEVIALFARTIVGACEARGAICGRLGGANFAVAAIDIGEAELQTMLEGLCHGLGFVLAEQGLESDLSFHCGATRHEGALPAFSALLAAADQALERARAQGDGQYEVAIFDSTDGGSQAWRARIELAFEQDRFVLYAQEVRGLPGRAPVHAEVTVRMLREGGEPVSAGVFLPMAARHGMIGQLDHHVTAKLLAHLATRPASLPPLALNISARSIADPEAYRRLLALIEARRDLAPRLIIEMTEFGALQDSKLSQRFSRDVQRLGAGFALDNFGMRQESLILVHALKPRYIKLSPGYSRELAGSADCRFLVAAIVRAAQPLDIGIYAQAVEDESLVPLLEKLGLAGYQGYASARPAPL